MKTGEDSNFGAQSKLLREKFVNIIAVRSLEFAEVMKQLGRGAFKREQLRCRLKRHQPSLSFCPLKHNHPHVH